MKRYPIELQDEQKACGVFCILMILKYYGFKDEISHIKEKTRMNQNGVSIKGIIECLKSYQIEAKAYEATLEEVDRENMYPSILFMVYDGIGHFVVLYEQYDDYCLIGDPARGLVKVTREEMNEHYSRRFIGIIHVGRVPQLHYQSYFTFLKNGFEAYQRPMKYLIYKGFEIAIIGYMSSYFFQIIIDYMKEETVFFYVIVLCITYGMMEMIKTLLIQRKNKCVIQLTKAFDEDYVFQSTMNMLESPLSFFEQDKGYIQSQLLSLYDLSGMSVECFERVFLDVISFIVFMIGMMVIDRKMTFIVVVMMLCVGSYTYYRLKKLHQLYKVSLESSLNYQNHLLELIENHFLIRCFDLFSRIHLKSYDYYQKNAHVKQQQEFYVNNTQTYTYYIVYMFYMVVLIYGFYLFQHHHFTIGQMMMFYMLMSYCLEPVIHVVNLASQYQYMTLIHEKYKVFQKHPDKKKEKLDERITSLTFDNVGYSYGYQKPLFEHIDLKIDKHVMIKGKTGSGKSTLLKLLMGYDLNYTGDIYINQKELSTIDLSSLYKHIGYANATPTFLHETLFDNFLCDDQEKIDQYLHIFHQESLRDMMHIVLNEDGSPLSFGQRQIVAMIRLLCHNYDVLILDEAFSHMDQELARNVFDYLMTNHLDCICIIVNHQTNIMYNNCECVIIEDGKIRNEGDYYGNRI